MSVELDENADTPIAEAARVMDGRYASCLVITGGSEIGIITDRDMRSRVVAAGVHPERPVADVMSSPVRTVAETALVFEAMLVMSELGIHHLPVEAAGQVCGMVTSFDIMRLLQADPIYLAADVQQATYEELEGAYDAAETQRLLTPIADNIARRPRRLFRRPDRLCVSRPRPRGPGAVPGGDDGVEP